MDQNLVKKARLGVQMNVCQEQDLISSLPDHILHEIMSLLPHRYAAKTSVFSHRWLNVWRTFPRIKLEETKFMNREQFLHSLRATFVHRELFNLQKLRLRMVQPGSLELYQLINGFMDVVLLQGTLTKIEISFLDCMHFRYEQLYVSPKEMFSLCSSLVALRIEGCRFEGCEPVNLPSLKALLMKDVIFETEDFLQELIQGCPVLENISIMYCYQIMNLRVFHPRVEKLVLGLNNQVESLELDVPRAKSIKFKALDHLDIELLQVQKIRATNLQTLHLKQFTMESEELRDITSIFPKIEKVKMRYCVLLGNVKVLSKSLTILKMSNCTLQEEVEIEAPNLQDITYFSNSRGAQLNTMMKFLHLTRIFLSNVQVREILWINDSLCPNLGSLDLISCNNLKQLRIANTKLESLKVYECEDLEHFVIVALKLSHFEYTGHVVRMLEVVGSRNLQVVLHLKTPRDGHGEMELVNLTQFLFKFDISAKALKVKLTYECAMCLLRMKDAYIPPLRHLLDLKIEIKIQVSSGLLDLLRCALRFAICHKTLSLHVGLFSVTLQFQEIGRKRKDNRAQACIEEHLVEVEIRNFQGRNEELDLIDFFIQNAKQMKQMIVWTTREGLDGSYWMHCLPCLFRQHFNVVSHGSYVLFFR